jgi:formylmethanofuran dehydrogenase subunit C
MTGGTILIDRDAGDFTGRRMRRGLIAIRGKAGSLLGHSMFAGSLIAGACGTYPGVEMSRGTICVRDAEHIELMPTFRRACTAHAPVLGMIGRELQSLGFENDLWNANRRWQLFNGDMIVSGRGELFKSPC